MVGVERHPDDVRAEGTRQENEIAARVQSSILSGDFELEGLLGISAGTLPAELVGGDYYDVITVPDGCWIAIGDVAGRGLAAGVIMLMIQSAVQSLVRLSPNGSPRDLLCALNAALYENIRERMKRDEHVTFCIGRYAPDGTLVFAGSHESVLIRRASGAFESIPLAGAWLGAAKDVGGATSETTVRLGSGDLMVLHTKGLVETRNGEGEPFGHARLRARLDGGCEQSPNHLRKAIMEALLAWNPRPDDDVTLVVVRGREISRVGTF
jgi:serine phosphatase RsbU (regulator of sigma subunit)